MIKQIKYKRLLLNFSNYLKSDTFIGRTMYLTIHFDKKTSWILFESNGQTLHINFTTLKLIGVVIGIDKKDVINTINELCNPDKLNIYIND